MKKLISLFVFAGFTCFAAQHGSKLSKDLAAIAAIGTGTVPVIVQWQSGTSASNNAAVAAVGGAPAVRLFSAKGGLYNVPASALNSLASNAAVAYISPDRPVAARLDNTAAAINARAAWSGGFTGAGVGVAVIDSGMNADPNLGSGKGPVYSYDFTVPANAQAAAAALATITGPLTAIAQIPKGMPAPDQFGHGQHVAGILASNGSASTCSNCNRSFKGVSYGASLIDLRVLDANGQGTESNVILAIDTAIALKNIYNIRVINLSLGSQVFESYTQDPLCQAVEAAWRAGIVVVVAAGNDGRDNSFGEQGYGTINSPGNDPYAITVGAMKTEGTYTRTDDLVASYSSKGPTAIDHIAKPDLMAPGNLVVSLLASGSTLQRQNPGNAVSVNYYQTVGGVTSPVSKTYFILSGTSMATPVVSAAAADLLQANPSLTPDQVKAILMQTAYKTFPQSSSVVDPTSGQTYTDYYDLFTVGAGYLDLGAAMAMVKTPPPAGSTAYSPVASMDPVSGTVSLSYDANAIWANRTMWGAQSIWSASTLDGNQVVWDSRTMWGASGSAASDCMWSTRTMWGADSTSATRTMWGANSNSTSATRTMWGADVTVVGEN